MQRLTESLKFPLDTFLRCQICGRESKEIVEFCMMWECDDQDKPEPGNVIVVCKQKPCKKVIDDHPRLYHELPWGPGAPGHFMLLCGDCPSRSGTGCTHKDLKANGGEGLEVRLGGLAAFNVTICGPGGCRKPAPSAVWCGGKPGGR